MQSKTLLPYLVLLGGVLVAASASILIRAAQQAGAPSITIAAGRMGLAALILLPPALRHLPPELRRLPRRDLLLCIAAGAVLAIHFAAWISSLAYTSVASSTALVATNPLWVALAALLLFRERLSAAVLAGIALTIGGSALIGLSDRDAAHTPNALLGDLLALLGAVAGSTYFLLGRELRERLSLLAYIWLVYTSAALVLTALALLLGWSGPAPTPTTDLLLGLPPVVWLLLLGLALGPQLLGHTAFNWSLRHLSATFVAIAILGEPIGSALLALLIFGEHFAGLQLAGFVLLLCGIAVAVLNEQRTQTRPAERAEAALIE